MNDMTLMERETRESPVVAMRLVDLCSAQLAEVGARLRTLEPRLILAAGRGSSDAAALLAKYVFETRLGLPTVSVAPSVHSIYGAKLTLEKALVLAISQSGRSPDLVEFCRAATGPDVLRIAMVNDAASPLTTAVDVTLPLMAGPETSVAATKSCIAAMTLVLGLAGHWRPESGMTAAFGRAASVLEKSIAADWSGADAFLDGDGPVYVVGRGPGLAIAAEAALKLKETSGLHAESISAAEIRHGPYALAGPSLRVIIFAQRDAAGLRHRFGEHRLGGGRLEVQVAAGQPGRPARQPTTEEIVHK
jgi:glucosamine--fructose-6-phosphate aminotransferase (isomerizing)